MTCLLFECDHFYVLTDVLKTLKKQVASRSNDVHLADFLESEFLVEQVMVLLHCRNTTTIRI